MNNPFYYTPSAACRQAAKEVAAWLEGLPSPFCDAPADTAFRNEIRHGKMFGVLVVEVPGTASADELLHRSGAVTYLAGYSGQIVGRSDWPAFVPAVFDYLQPHGYFKEHEAEIVSLNHEIAQAQADSKTTAPLLTSPADDPRPALDKQQHDGESEEAFIRRRQYENAELHRWKLRQREREAERLKAEEAIKARVSALKTLRRRKSDDLQHWLFHNFRMHNGKGETMDLIEITRWYHAADNSVAGSAIPPAGSGECCEPKLLQYALMHGLKPVSMAMFWWGESPRGEIRHHLQYYPACNSKCKPILKWMLQGIAVDANPLESSRDDDRLAAQLKVLYEDDSLCVVSKPSGLLSVPGKSGRQSVYSLMRQRYPDTDSPLIVHRLDMDTSGVMIIAKTMEAYHNLQKQFADHQIQKRYVAVLSHERREAPQSRDNDAQHDGHKKTGNDSNVISLPLRPDVDDRPRQVVDFDNGRPAVTYYKYVSPTRIWLWPRTGRTHQLRVHCAHSLGLDNPIKGDNLYGEPADRLYLHAEAITFRHPTTGKMMTITDKAGF